MLVFDGVCKLCSRAVRFVLSHEREPSIRFATMQSRTGKQVMRENGIDPDDAKTFVFVCNDRAYVRSDAAIELAEHLRGGWRLLRFVKAVPRPMRNWLYDVVARNRYRWFGRYDACVLPTPEFDHRFIDD